MEGKEREPKRCCDASPHDTKVMRVIRGWMNEHHPTDCDRDIAVEIIGLLETFIKLQHAAGITITVLEDKKLHVLIENSEAGLAYEDFLRIEADRLRPFLPTKRKE